MYSEERTARLTSEAWELAEMCFDKTPPLFDVIKARSPEVEASIINLVQAFDSARQAAMLGSENSQVLDERVHEVQKRAQAFKTAVLAEVRNDIQGMPEPGSAGDVLGYVHSAPPGDKAAPKSRFDLQPGHKLEAAVPLSGALNYFNKAHAEEGVDTFCKTALFVAVKHNIEMLKYDS